MSFLQPLGFLGLIAVPILIIIYILKNKYVEQVIPATYLWTLSEKFLKRRNPIRRITGIISLILQILAVIFISTAIAHPVFTLANAADDYCFILDGSGSMNIVREDNTRFDLGKQEIASLIKSSAGGSLYTLVYAGRSTDVIYEQIDDKERALALLEETSPSYCATGFVNAISAAQEYFNANPSLQVFVVTDKSYENTENVTIINVSSNEENYSLSDVEYNFKGRKLVVGGKAVSYESSAELAIKLYIDDAEEPEQTLNLAVEKLEITDFEFTSDSVDFQSLKVVIENTDALSLDNVCNLYNIRNESSFTTLIVSDAPFFIEAVLTSLGYSQIEKVSTAKYSERAGFGLYIFDSFSPESLPHDGAVWFINPTTSVADSGFSVQGEIGLSGSGKLVYNESSATRVRNLLANLAKTDNFIFRYVKCGQYRTFTNLLSFDGNPMVFAGSNAYGNREVVFAFDFHNSDLPLSSDFAVLINNLVNYTFPPVIDGSSYYCGDSVEINVLANCTSIRVDSPHGNVSYLDTGDAIAEYELKETGIYTITAMVGNLSRQVNLFAAIPFTERFTTVSEQSFIISGEASSERRDGKYDDLIILFIILAVLFIADWMVYCYEQYQLR